MNYLKSRQAKIYIFLIIIAIVFSTIVFSYTRKPNIHNATTCDLKGVYGIGDKLAISIHDYVIKHDIDRVSELEGKVHELGKIRLQKLKEVYK